MTYKIAKAKVIAVATAVTPTETSAVPDAAPFAHVAEGDSQQAKSLRSRSLWIEAGMDGDGHIALPYTPDIAGQPRVATTCTLTIHYRQAINKRDDLDATMEADALAIAKVLLTPSNFSDRTVGNVDWIDGLSWRRVSLPGGDMQTKITFVMHYL